MIEFIDKLYEEFIEIPLKIEVVESYDNNYLNSEYHFASKELEFKFLYSLAKNFIDVYTLSTKDIFNCIFITEDKYYKPIYYTLRAIDLLENDNVNFQIEEYIKRAYVNLGNYYANQFRVYEAFDCYNAALRYYSYFGMANGNRLIAFEKTSCLNYYVDNDKLFYYLADEYSAIDINSIENGELLFKQKKSIIRSY